MKNVIHVMKLEIILKINVKVVNMDMKNLILIVLYVIKIKNIFIMILQKIIMNVYMEIINVQVNFLILLKKQENVLIFVFMNLI